MNEELKINFLTPEGEVQYFHDQAIRDRALFASWPPEGMTFESDDVD